MDDAIDKDFKIKIYLVTVIVVLAGYPFPLITVFITAYISLSSKGSTVHYGDSNLKDITVRLRLRGGSDA